MEITSLGDQVSLFQGRTQAQLKSAVTALSSGLRINTAADDPSGLAISEKLQAKVNGLDQGAQSIQDANNALNVADGALQTISAILQRLRTLIVAANSDLESDGDKADVQTEITQLLQEINRIVQNTQFNGRQLLDGSASSQPPRQASIYIAENDSLTGGGTLIDTTLDPNEPEVYQPPVPTAVIVQVQSYDPSSNQVNVRIKAFSSDPSFGPTQDTNDPSQGGPVQVTAGTDFPTLEGAPPTPGNPSISIATQLGLGSQVLSFNLGTLNANDVGAQAILFTIPAGTKAPGQAIEVNNGNAEGTVNSIDIPSVSTINLAINDISVGDSDTNTVSEYKVDFAINYLANVRAQVGAQTVALQDAGENNAIAAVNYQASESQIRDTNIGQTVSDYTKDQILVNIQTAVLSRLYAVAPEVVALVQGGALA